MTDTTLFDQIISLERRLHRPEIRSSRPELDQLLSDDFQEFGASGKVYGKNEIINFLLDDPGLELKVENEVVKLVAPTVCLVTYTSVKSVGDSCTRSNRSSIWKWSDEAWKMVFHQGTRIE